MADPEARVVVTAHDATAAAFGSANRNLQQFRSAVSGFRTLLGSFGVALSARAFAGWIRGALDAKNMTEEQVRATEEARVAMQQMKSASDELARSLSFSLIPAMQSATGILGALNREFFGIDTRNEAQKQIDHIQQLRRELQELRTLQNESPVAVGADIVRKQAEIDAAVRQERLDRMDREFAEPIRGAPDPLQGFDIDAIRAQRVELMRSMPTFDANAPSPEALQRAQQITASMATDVERQVEAWREAKALFDQGLLSADTLTRVQDSLLEPIEVTAERIKDLNVDMQSESAKTAAAIGANFQDAFASWLGGADQGFSELLKRMAAEMATSSLFKSLASMFGGATTGTAGFFANFFGGARAGGGPVTAGKGYLVGERGPELFMPSRSGSIIPNGPGDPALVQHFHVQVGLPPQWEAQLAGVGQMAAAEAYKAVTARMGGRR